MSTRARNILRSLGAMAVLAGIVIGIPIVLVAIAGWPLPTKVPDFDHVRVALRQGDLPAAVVIKTIAVVVWIVWVQLAWAVAFEISTAVRSRGGQNRARPAPLVPTALGVGMSRLVAIALSIGIATSTITTSLVRAAPAAAAVAAGPPPEPATVALDAPARGAPITATGPQWLVEKGDTCWDIAEIALGDGARVNEILELNPTLGSPRHLHVGRILSLPVDARVPADRVPVAAAPEPRPEPVTTLVVAGGYLAGETISIQRGDNVWNLAEQRLDVADGPVDTPTATDIADYVEDVIRANDFPSGSPSLIRPGEHYTFPAIGTPPTPAPTAPTAPAADTVPPTAAPPAAVPTMESPTPRLPPPTVPTTVVSSTARPPTAISATPDLEAGSRQSMPWLAGIGGATVVASSLLVTYRALRRRQATAGAATIRQTRPTGRRHDIERALVAAADVPLVRWAGHELATLFYRITPNQIDGAPIAVEISEAHGIELLWDTANPVASRPWEPVDEGWAWRRAYDPDQQIPAERQPAPVPGLVTIGERDGNQVLVDLEAFGTLVVRGDPTRAADLVRAVVLELAAGDDLSDSWLDLVGVTVAGTEHFERVRMTSTDTALQRLSSTVHEFERTINERHVTNSFQMRAGQRPGGHELAVIIAGSHVDGADALVEQATARRGVAVVMLGDIQNGDGVASITIDTDGTAVLSPLGLTLQAAGVPHRTATDVASLLEAAVSPPTETPVDGTVESDAPASTDATSLGSGADIDLVEAGKMIGDEDTCDGWHEPKLDIVVQLLGPPALLGYDLPNTELNVVAYLVCNGGQAGIDQTVNAVWGGRAVKRTTVWNKVSKIRQVLGRDNVPDTAEETLRVTANVGSDIQIFAALADRSGHTSASEAISLLARALELIRGVPFDAERYDWAHEQQHHAQACEIIEAAALRLVDLGLDADDPAAARHAIVQGLRALPRNEPLYRARMRLEHSLGNIDGVRSAYAELVNLLDDLDGKGAYQPSARTKALLEQLLTDT